MALTQKKSKVYIRLTQRQHFLQALTLMTLNPKNYLKTVKLIQHQKQENCIPDTLTSLYDPSSINLSKTELHNLCEDRYKEYVDSYTQTNYDNLTEITKKQNLSKIWMYHRASRITASVSYKVDRMKTQPSESLTKTIMQYNDLVDTKFTSYGRETEPEARRYYTNKLKDIHADFSVDITGFHVNADEPYLGASPDALVFCSCHAKKILEIKCPFKYKAGIVNWYDDKDFILDKFGKIKPNHPYYHQVQIQMHVTGYQYADLLIYSPAINGSSGMIVNVTKDEAVIKPVFAKSL